VDKGEVAFERAGLGSEMPVERIGEKVSEPPRLAQRNDVD
jgi:hypothetical protein